MLSLSASSPVCGIADVEGESGDKGSYQCPHVTKKFGTLVLSLLLYRRWECTWLQCRSTLGRTLLIERRAGGDGKGISSGKRDNVHDRLGKRKRGIRRNDHSIEFISAETGRALVKSHKDKAPNEFKHYSRVACVACACIGVTKR